MVSSSSWLLVAAVCLVPSKAEDVSWSVTDDVKEATATDHPPRLTFRVTLPFGQELTLDLIRHDSLLHQDYKTLIGTSKSAGDTWENGLKHRTHSRVADRTHSAYQGSKSYAAVTVCGHGDDVTLEGVFEHEGRVYTLEPGVPRYPSSPDKHSRFRRSGDNSVFHRISSPVVKDYGIDYIIPNSKTAPVAFHHWEMQKALMEKKHSGEMGENNNRTRVKRTGTEYEIEVMVFADYQLYSRFYDSASGSSVSEKQGNAISSLEYYFVHYVNFVDLRYRGITGVSWSLSVKLVGLHIAMTQDAGIQTQLDSTTFEDKPAADAYDAYDRFDAFILENGSHASFPTFDHAMLVTGYELITISNSGAKSGGIAGLATVSGVCTDHRTSINEFGGAWSGGVVAAHELGHNMGSGHDGSGSGAGCSSSNQNIMTGVVSATSANTHANYFLFSSCSIDQFDTLLDSLNTDNNNCLKNTGTAASIYDEHISQRPGQVYDVHQQCAQMHGEGWTYEAGSESENVCTRLLCIAPDQRDNTYGGARGADGTTCGNRKWCDTGVCTAHSDAPVASDTCPHGDSTSKLYSNTEDTCDTIEANDCYSSYVEGSCCARCPSEDLGIEGCQYGDKADCSSISAKSCYSSSTESTCCKTCLDYQDSSLPSDCLYGDKNSVCGPQHCTSASNNATCCATCAPPTTAAPVTNAASTTTSAAGDTTSRAMTSTMTVTVTDASTTSTPSADTTSAAATSTPSADTTAAAATSTPSADTTTATTMGSTDTSPTNAPTTAATEPSTPSPATPTPQPTSTAAPYREVGFSVSIRFAQGSFPACDAADFTDRSSAIYQLIESIICNFFAGRFPWRVSSCRVTSFGCGSIVAASAVSFQVPVPSANDTNGNSTSANGTTVSPIDGGPSLQDIESGLMGLENSTEISYMGSEVETLVLTDECASPRVLSFCPDIAACVDTADSYYCICPAGWTDGATANSVPGTVCTQQVTTAPTMVFTSFTVSMVIESLGGSSLTCANLSAVSNDPDVSRQVCSHVSGNVAGVNECEVTGFSCGSIVADVILTLLTAADGTTHNASETAIRNQLEMASSDGIVVSSYQVSAIAPCSEQHSVCSSNAMCVSTVNNGYSCQCDEGYEDNSPEAPGRDCGSGNGAVATKSPVTWLAILCVVWALNH